MGVPIHTRRKQYFNGGCGQSPVRIRGVATTHAEPEPASGGTGPAQEGAEGHAQARSDEVPQIGILRQPRGIA